MPCPDCIKGASIKSSGGWSVPGKQKRQRQQQQQQQLVAAGPAAAAAAAGGRKARVAWPGGAIVTSDKDETFRAFFRNRLKAGAPLTASQRARADQLGIDYPGKGAERSGVLKSNAECAECGDSGLVRDSEPCFSCTSILNLIDPSGLGRRMSFTTTNEDYLQRLPVRVLRMTAMLYQIIN